MVTSTLPLSVPCVVVAAPPFTTASVTSSLGLFVR